MRIVEDIDARLAFPLAAQRSIRKQGCVPSTCRNEEPLGERGTATDG